MNTSVCSTWPSVWFRFGQIEEMLARAFSDKFLTSEAERDVVLIGETRTKLMVMKFLREDLE